MKLCHILLSSALAREHYDGDKVFRLKIDSQEKLELFKSLAGYLDVWKEPRNFEDFGDVRVSKKELDRFEVLLKSKKIQSEIFIDNVEEMVEQTFQDVAAGFNDFYDFNYEQYHRFEDYQEWQAQFAEINSDLIEIENLGISFEVKKFKFFIKKKYFMIL